MIASLSPLLIVVIVLIAVIRSQESYLRTFEKSSASSPKSARRLSELGLAESRAFHQLARRGVFQQTDASLWFLDDRAADRFRTRRRSGIILGLTMGALVVLAIYLLIQ